MAISVARRRGTNRENQTFVGNDGEITVNTTSKTLHVHIGDGIAGGTELATADLNNVSTTPFTKDRGVDVTLDLDYGPALMRADMKNFGNGTYNNDSAVESALKTTYSLASTDATNINTTDMTLSTREGDGPILARADAVNINTADLVDPNKHPTGSSVGNKPLAYADLSNASGITEGFAQKDMSNVDNGTLAIAKADPLSSADKPLAYADLSNMTTDALTSKDVQFTTFMDTSTLSTDETRYPNSPTVQRVVTAAIAGFREVPGTTSADQDKSPYFLRLDYDMEAVGWGYDWSNIIPAEAVYVTKESEAEGGTPQTELVPIDSLLTNLENRVTLLDSSKAPLLFADEENGIALTLTTAFVDNPYDPGERIKVPAYEISSTNDKAAWGNITGTLSDQDDLADAFEEVNTKIGEKASVIIRDWSVTE